MNDIVLQNQINNIEDFSISEIIENFTQLKNSRHTQRSYKSDISAFFNSIDVVFLADFGLIPYPKVVDLVKEFLNQNTKKDLQT
jgi:hypothetical protein